MSQTFSRNARRSQRWGGPPAPTSTLIGFEQRRRTFDFECSPAERAAAQVTVVFHLWQCVFSADVARRVRTRSTFFSCFFFFFKGVVTVTLARVRFFGFI